jgi:glycosyltransferase involved in cell wall biosynthesis
MDKRVFIGVPTFNRDNSIIDCLNSLNNQSYKDFKVVISDNASTDNTRELIQAFCEKKNNFEYVIQEENIGWYRNFKYLLECGSEYEYFMWAPSDDTWSDNFLAECIKVLEHSQDIAVVQSSAYLKYPSRRELSTKIDYLNRMDSISNFRLVNLIFSRGYAFFIMGMFRTSMLKIIFSNFPQTPSADRYFLLQIPLNGWRMATTSNAYYYRAIHEILAPDRYPDDEYLQKTKKSAKLLFDYSSFKDVHLMVSKSINRSKCLSYYIFIMFVISRTKVGTINSIKYFLKFFGQSNYKKIELCYKKIRKR